MSEQIHCNLTENALDYLLLADELAGLAPCDIRGESHKLKHSIATLTDGLELLLKARIEIADWKLLFAIPSKASQQDYESGNFLSLKYSKLPDKLTEHCGIVLLSDQVSMLTILGNMRNKIRHFSITVDQATVSAILVRGLSFALDFIGLHLRPHKQSDGSFLDDVTRLGEALGKNKSVVEERLRSLPTLDSGFIAIERAGCPVCDQTCLCTNATLLRCRFCTYTSDPSTAAIDIMLANGVRYKDLGSEKVTWDCHSCGIEAVIKVPVDGSPSHVCLACGETADFHHCEHCDELFVPEPYDDDGNPSWICNDCERQRIDSAD